MTVAEARAVVAAHVAGLRASAKDIHAEIARRDPAAGTDEIADLEILAEQLRGCAEHVALAAAIAVRDMEVIKAVEGLLSGETTH
jgi:hypothetical protein